MITLNLLAPGKKQELQLKRLYQIIKNLIILTLLVTIATAIILLLTKMVLQNHFNDVVEQTTLTTKNVQIFNKDIKDFNKYVKAIDNIQNNYIPWFPFLTQFLNLAPQEIQIYNIDIKEEIMLITGLAKNRSELLKFKENLDQSDLFIKIDIPLENLLQKENVKFTIRTELELDKLKNEY